MTRVPRTLGWGIHNERNTQTWRNYAEHKLKSIKKKKKKKGTSLAVQW